jgi:diadenosine tetraphosphatase ApaH/serine/threonine PP2A family protein phosphatase
MRYAVISDIHANLEALLAVLGDAQPQAEALVCLGDIVGYNANPNECVRFVQDLCDVAIAGNHDQAAIGSRRDDDFNSNARTAIAWTKQQLTPASLAYLRCLPTTAAFGKGGLAAHGSPQDTDEYLVHRRSIQQSFAYLQDALPDVRCCFVGHTHVPMIWQCTPQGVVSLLQGIFSRPVLLDRSRRYLINPGSVGQPRHGDPAASYLLFDDEMLTVTFRFVPYDVATTQEKIYDALLPIALAERLEVGR